MVLQYFLSILFCPRGAGCRRIVSTLVGNRLGPRGSRNGRSKIVVGVAGNRLGPRSSRDGNASFHSTFSKGLGGSLSFELRRFPRAGKEFRKDKVLDDDPLVEDLALCVGPR